MSVANFTTIIELKITHGRDGTEWFIVNPSNPNQSYGYFESLTIEEGILNVIPSGTLVLRDEGDLISDFNFTGKDKFYLRIKDSGDNEIELSNYYVYQVARATDYQKRNDPRFVTIKFIHESFFFNERSVFEFEEDIKPISKTELVDSWVGQIFAKYFPEDWERRTAYASDTKNYAWLKHKNLVYPNGRKADQTKILNLLNYFAENANVDNDPPRTDFFFWKDLTGVNFLSLGDEIAASETPEGRYGVYDRDSIAPDGIVKIDDISVFNFSFMDLETSGAFQSYYERVDPNLDQPHFYLMDSTNSLKTKIINFNFLDYYPDFVDYLDKPEDKKGSEPIGGESWEPDGNIANYEIINFGGQEIDISALQGATAVRYTKRLYDEEKFGYFDHSFNNNYDDEPKYFLNTDAGITFNDFSNNRTTYKLWQTMFDIDEESPIDIDDSTKNIGKLFVTLKKSKRDAANTYFKLRNLKEQWNIFKYVVCCIRKPQKEEFWALLTGYSSVNESYTKAKAYKYDWKEIFFLPTGITGITLSKDINIKGNPYFGITYGGRESGSTFKAYNLNEIMNVEGDDAISNYSYAGPGTNMISQGYPANFVNIPIGALQNTSSSTVDLIFHGQIVKMYQIDFASIEGISFNKANYDSNSFLYYFDVQNDKEGLCDEPVEGGGGGGGQSQQGNCCAVTPGVGGCLNVECTNLVLSYDDTCANSWDAQCVELAQALCCGSPCMSC
jgi:hypothetical protein